PPQTPTLTHTLLHSLFYYSPPPHPDPHSFPTRRSSDLISALFTPSCKFESPFFLAEDVDLRMATTNRSDQPAWQQNDIFREEEGDRKSTRLNSSHSQISYAVFCLKKKKKISINHTIITH